MSDDDGACYAETPFQRWSERWRDVVNPDTLATAAPRAAVPPCTCATCRLAREMQAGFMHAMYEQLDRELRGGA